MGLIPGLGRSPGGRQGNPFQYSCLESPLTEEPGWPQIEFFSSGGQESWCLRVIQQQPFILGARPGSFRTR